MSLLIRFGPELWLGDRDPPGMITDALPWLPIAVVATMAGILHFGADPALRLEYLAAAALGGLTLIWRQSFYLPLLVGAAFLATYRHFFA